MLAEYESGNSENLDHPSEGYIGNIAASLESNLIWANISAAGHHVDEIGVEAARTFVQELQPGCGDGGGGMRYPQQGAIAHRMQVGGGHGPQPLESPAAWSQGPNLLEASHQVRDFNSGLSLL
jgi:hypothetical protein